MPTKRKLSLNNDYAAPPPSIIKKYVKDAVKDAGWSLGTSTGAQIGELQTKLASEGQGRTDSLDHMINLFTGAHDLGIPNDKRYVTFDAKSSKPADVIFRVMGMLLAPLRCQYLNMGTKNDDVQRAAELESHLNALYPTLFRRTQERWDVQSLFWQLLGGNGFLQQSYLPYYWDKNELRRRPGEKASKDADSDEVTEKDHDYNDRVYAYKQFSGPPIMVEAIDPRMLWPIRTKAKGIIGWVKKYKVTRYDFCEAFRNRGKSVMFDENGQARVEPGVAGMEYAETADVSMTEGLDYYEYIDDRMVYYVQGESVVDSYEHNGGIKIFPAYGLQTGLNEPHLSAVGILWPVRNEVVQLDFYQTLWGNKAFLEIFPQLFAILEKNDDPLKDEDGNATEWTLEPGTVKQLRGQLVNAMKDSSSGTDFRALIEHVANEIDSSTISGIARGQAGAQQPGYSINQLAQAMRTLWKGIIESRELQLSSMYEHYLWMVKNIIKEPVAVYAEGKNDEKTGRRTGAYVTVGPDDIDDYYRVEANLNPDLPIDKQGNIQLYASLYDKGLVDWDIYVRDGLGLDNPIPLLRKVRKEAMQKESLAKAMEDGMKLGQIRLENRILKEQGFTDLNEVFSTDVQQLKAGREGQEAAQIAGMPPGGAGGPPAMPQAAPAPAPAGGGMPPTFGANPADSAPGPRMGDAASGMGIR